MTWYDIQNHTDIMPYHHMVSCSVSCRYHAVSWQCITFRIMHISCSVSCRYHAVSWQCITFRIMHISCSVSCRYHAVSWQCITFRIMHISCMYHEMVSCSVSCCDTVSHPDTVSCCDTKKNKKCSYHVGIFFMIRTFVDIRDILWYIYDISHDMISGQTKKSNLTDKEVTPLSRSIPGPPHCASGRVL